MLIGFAGKMGAGKSTAAKIFVRGNDVFSFAKPLKKALQTLFLLTDEQLYTTEGKARFDPRWGMTSREICQYFGTDLMRAWIPGFWEKLMREQLAQIDFKGQNVAIDDVRFQDEAQMIRDLGGKVVHITGRSTQLRSEKEAEHESEKGLDIFWEDSVIDNSGSIEDLRRKIRELEAYISD